MTLMLPRYVLQIYVFVLMYKGSMRTRVMFEKVMKVNTYVFNLNRIKEDEIRS